MWQHWIAFLHFPLQQIDPSQSDTVLCQMSEPRLKAETDLDVAADRVNSLLPNNPKSTVVPLILLDSTNGQTRRFGVPVLWSMDSAKTGNSDWVDVLWTCVLNGIPTDLYSSGSVEPLKERKNVWSKVSTEKAHKPSRGHKHHRNVSGLLETKTKWLVSPCRENIQLHNSSRVKNNTSVEVRDQGAVFEVKLRECDHWIPRIPFVAIGPLALKAVWNLKPKARKEK